MKELLFRYLMALTMSVTVLSCVEDQDFDQFDDLNVTPTITSSILYLESDEDFINSATTITPFLSQIFDFEAFTEEFVAERLLRGSFIYEIENTTSKQLDLTIEFLDEMDNVLDTETFTVEAEPAPLISREIAYGPGGKSLDILRNTFSLRVSILNLSDTTSTSTASDPRILLRSAAEFIFELQ